LKASERALKTKGLEYKNKRETETHEKEFRRRKGRWRGKRRKLQMKLIPLNQCIYTLVSLQIV
jgi:hypothetical protein